MTLHADIISNAADVLQLENPKNTENHPHKYPKQKGPADMILAFLFGQRSCPQALCGLF
jgi:hypothetical protein